jgi:hypothetical protein
VYEQPFGDEGGYEKPVEQYLHVVKRQSLTRCVSQPGNQRSALNQWFIHVASQETADPDSGNIFFALIHTNVTD